MAYIGQPFVTYKCDGCGHEIHRQVSTSRAQAELRELRDEPAHYCAGCAQRALRASIAVERDLTKMEAGNGNV
jgi:hypothetical protein